MSISLGFLSVKIYSYAWCLRYNICSAWFLDVRISTCLSLKLIATVIIIVMAIIARNLANQPIQFSYTMQGVQLTTAKHHHHIDILLDQRFILVSPWL